MIANNPAKSHISALVAKSQAYLEKLCLEIPGRRVGSAGNRAATDYFEAVVASFGWDTQRQEFDCLDWTQAGARLTAGGESFEVSVSPYSLGCQVSAPMAVASTVEELAALELSNHIVLLRGEIAKEQLMPKEFPFYNPDHHRRIIHLLETKQPLAIIAATGRNPELAGGLYPFPLIEDGDFDIPSVFMTEESGEKLATQADRTVSLGIEARRSPARGWNVVARKGAGASRRLVVCAHIDAKAGTSGALDNAAGVVVLLLLAELWADYAGEMALELVAINGEDHYSAAGEIQYLAENADRLGDIVVAVNIDAAGYHQGQTAYSLYGCPPELAGAIRQAFSSRKDMIEGEPWYQSDHSIFVQNQVPAVAITSDRLIELSTDVTHTPKDRPELVDCRKLVDVALALQAILDENRIELIPMQPMESMRGLLKGIDTTIEREDDRG
jgi:aminopeptidase YwaD